jgi:kinetochore protein Nuf2
MFFIHVKRLVKTAGVETFTLQDLTRPEHARVCDCFSAVINFAKFKCARPSVLCREAMARTGRC